MESVAVVTGAERGIGLGLARRLLREHSGSGQFRLCLACFTLEAAKGAQQKLLKENPGARVDVMQIDVSSPASVLKAAEEIKERYKSVDWLYCNAGKMPVAGVNWKAFWPLTPANLKYVFTHGGCFVQVEDRDTPDGLKDIFATNAFGHFVLIRELEDFLCSQGRPCHIVWTSSASTCRAHVDPDDIQARKSEDSYAASKQLIDLFNRELNHRLNDKGVYSHTTCPGLVITRLTLGIIGVWFWVLIMPVLLTVRLILTRTMTLSSYNGTEALVWLSKQDPAALDHSVKYCSRITSFGKLYVDREKLTGSDELCREVYSKMEDLAKQFTARSSLNGNA